MPADQRPDPSRLHDYPLSIWYVKEGETWYIKTISEDYRGIFTHYTKPSQYCPGAKCNCRLKAKRRVWLGYASVERWDERHGLWLPCVLQITEGLDHDFDGVYRRGQLWKLTRKAGDENKKHYPVSGVLEGTVKPEELAEPFPYLPTLLRAYHTEEIAEWYPNPVPKPSKVTPHKAGPPAPLASKQVERPAASSDWKLLRNSLNGVGSVPADHGNGKVDNV